jgi:hypothetical protein
MLVRSLCVRNQVVVHVSRKRTLYPLYHVPEPAQRRMGDREAEARFSGKSFAQQNAHKLQKQV